MSIRQINAYAYAYMLLIYSEDADVFLFKRSFIMVETAC